MKAWWTALELRERRVVGLGVVIVAAALLYALAWRPLELGTAAVGDQVRSLRADVVWMRQAAVELKRRRGGAAPSESARTPLPVLLSTISKEQRMDRAIAGLEPQDNGRVAVTVKQVEVGRFLHWMQALRDRGVRVASMDLVPEGPGGVRAKLLLDRDRS